MGSVHISKKAHAVIVPYPTQGHITPAFTLAKLLHSHGFHITFVNTDFNHHRLLRSQGAAALAGLPDFNFESIPDGLPPSDLSATQDIPALCTSIHNNFLFPPFLELLEKLKSGTPPVTQIISDALMSFCVDAGKKHGIPVTGFWTASACGLMGYLHFQALIQRGITPFKDESYLKNGYLETGVDWIPGMKNIRLKDLPSFFRTTNPNEILFNFLDTSSRRLAEAKAIIINTFDDLERPVLDALSASLLIPAPLPPIYTIGPINLLSRRLSEISPLKSNGANLWKEDAGCIEWLDGRNPRSVVLVNFGSITVMSRGHLVEFAWGLANSGYDILWVIRGDLVKGESAMLPPEFVEETKGRALMASWCAQEEVLAHPAVGVFLTHAGWNSILESFSAGVPVICWPFFAEQHTNCRYAEAEWGVGMEIDGDVKREEVEVLIRKAMEEEEEGKEMKKRAMEWKQSAVTAIQKGGSSFANFERVVKEVLL
ncbi:UDP-glycosyltransferase 85A2 [Platanthera zijinensis]|uniref:Glycosyltransferase n=1 Tax=Platanthera zijinensis TaxID=2320716 RepID=A0AAP0G0Q1_9ASPA